MKPGDFPLGSVQSRAAARIQMKNQKGGPDSFYDAHSKAAVGTAPGRMPGGRGYATRLHG
jgi:hypothetical protein